MDIFSITRSPIDDAVDTDRAMLGRLDISGQYYQFRTEIDELILSKLACSADEYGDMLTGYWDNLNL